MTGDDYFSHIDSSDDELRKDSSGKTVARKPAETHRCLECDGTGLYKGVRRHQEKAHCFACRGKGFFKMSYADRMKAKAKREEQAAAKKESAQEAFIEANPGLIEALRGMADWNQFAQSMIIGFDKYNSLTEKQIAASWSMIHKIEAKKAEKTAAIKRREAAVEENALQGILAAFASAREAGLKKPKFRTPTVTLSLAGERSRNPGAIYVVIGPDYCGKITPDGKFIAGRDCPDDIADKLAEIAGDPKEAALAYGRETGSCACCGRELTDPASVAAGIGPVCADNWGF